MEYDFQLNSITMETDKKIIELFKKIEDAEMHDYDSDPGLEVKEPWFYIMEIANLVINNRARINSYDLDDLYNQMRMWHPDHDMTKDIRYLRLNRLK